MLRYPIEIKGERFVQLIDLSRVEILPLLGGLGVVLAAACATYFPVLYVLSERFRSLVRDVFAFLRQQSHRVF